MDTSTFLLEQPPLNVEPTLELSTYPNPAIDHFRLESNKQLTLDVYDGNGVLLIKSSTNTRVDIKHLPEGMYFIKVQDEHNETIGIQKLIKKWLNQT